ncbi:MAG: DUF3187 family protein [Planctomycetota bacterium]
MRHAGHLAALVLPLVGGCALLPELSSEQAARVRGPLGTRMPHPILMNFPHLGLRRAVVTPSGEFAAGATLSYSSIYEAGASNGDVVRMDGELAQATLRARAGLGKGFELEAQGGLLHGGGGSLDSVVLEFHDFFGFPNAGRRDVPNDQFDMRVVNDGVEGYALRSDELQVQDLALTLAWGGEEARAGGWSQLVRGTVELPTGSESDGFGNGAVDFGLGWNAELDLGRSTLFACASWAHPGASSAMERAGIQLFERVCVGGAWELRLTERTSGIVQLEWLNPLSNSMNLEEFDASYFDFVLGLSHDLGGRWRATLAFQEDLVAAAGTDFSVVCGLGWGL